MTEKDSSGSDTGNAGTATRREAAAWPGDGTAPSEGTAGTQQAGLKLAGGDGSPGRGGGSADPRSRAPEGAEAPPEGAEGPAEGSEGPACPLQDVQREETRAKGRCAMLSILSNSTLIVLKLAAGIATGSIAVISEAIHSFLDLLAAIMTFAAVRISGAPPDREHPFGHGKAENIAALFEALLIIAGGLYIVHESIEALAGGGSLPSPGPGVAVMFASSLINFLVSRHLFRTGRRYGSPALVTDAWHLMTDVYTSLGIFAALLAINVGRWIDPSLDLAFIDPAAAMCVSCLIIKTGWTLARDALATLVDHSLPDDDLQIIEETIRGEPGIRGYRSLRTRRAGPFRFVTVELLVDGSLTVSEAHALGEEVALAVSGRFPRAEFFFHLEPEGSPARGAAGADGSAGFLEAGMGGSGGSTRMRDRPQCCCLNLSLRRRSRLAWRVDYT